VDKVGQRRQHFSPTRTPGIGLGPIGYLHFIVADIDTYPPHTLDVHPAKGLELDRLTRKLGNC
jgi:hypothetical protein